MAFIDVKPGTLLSPTPVVMVSCGSVSQRPNIITVAWAGTVNSDPPMLSVSIRPDRHSHDIIRDSGEFVVNLVNRELLKACDLCGVRSGREHDKFSLCGLTPFPAAGLASAPAIDKSPAYLACRVKESLALGSHTLFIGEIVSMGIEETLMDASGKIDFHKAGLVAYSHGEYTGLTEPLGFFGFSVARPEVIRRRMRK
ncbi:MAG: flavin reductase family protein [Eubacteriales bacterium]|nr:flavin reductase family protein [Eubacteriales bacterium]